MDQTFLRYGVKLCSILGPEVPKLQNQISSFFVLLYSVIEVYFTFFLEMVAETGNYSFFSFLFLNFTRF